MSSGRNDKSVVSGTAKTFWRNRHFWAMISAIVCSCIIIGYLIGTWYATTAYKEASESRKLILAQCIATNGKLTSQIADLGDKTADALDRMATERK